MDQAQLNQSKAWRASQKCSGPSYSQCCAFTTGRTPTWQWTPSTWSHGGEKDVLLVQITQMSQFAVPLLHRQAVGSRCSWTRAQGMACITKLLRAFLFTVCRSLVPLLHRQAVGSRCSWTRARPGGRSKLRIRQPCRQPKKKRSKHTQSSRAIRCVCACVNVCVRACVCVCVVFEYGSCALAHIMPVGT